MKPINFNFYSVKEIGRIRIDNDLKIKKVLILLIMLVLLTACGEKKDNTVTKVNDNKTTTKTAITTKSAITTPAVVIPPDAMVIIHQNTLNNFLKAMGKITGKAPFKVLFINGEYNWNLDNAKIEFTQNNARFTADAGVSIGNIFTYSSLAEGNVDVWYDNIANKIHVKMQEAIFEVYINVLGNKIHITDIDAAKFYKPEFEFAGPQPMQTDIDITLPDLTNRKIKVRITGQNLYIEKEQIKVTSTLKFEQVPVGITPVVVKPLTVVPEAIKPLTPVVTATAIGH